VNNIKDYFPFFKETGWNYLDSAATSQKPTVMMEELCNYYTKYNSNIGRSVYDLAHKSEELLGSACKKINQFLGKSGNLSFSDGCTASLNEAVFYIQQLYTGSPAYFNKDTIILSVFEHHANIMAWIRFTKTYNLQIYWIEKAEELEDFSNIPPNILERALVISVCHVNNVTGEVNNLASLNKLKAKYGFLWVVDGAQATTNVKWPLGGLNVDFYAFSAHKIYGPMGLAVLWISKKIAIENPYKLGGGIIDDVTQSGYTLSNENNLMAGTQNIANIHSFGMVIDWLGEQEEVNYKKTISCLKREIENLDNVRVLEISNKLEKTNILSINTKGIHAHDLGTFLSNKKIAVRAGKHCAHTFLNKISVNSSIRVSLGIYNDEHDLEEFVMAIKEGLRYFS